MKVDRKALRLLLEEVEFESILHLMSQWRVSVRGVKDKEDALTRIWEAGVTPVRLEDLLAVLDLERNIPSTFWRVYRFIHQEKTVRAGTLERRLNRELSRDAVSEEHGYFRALNAGSGVIYVFYRFEGERLVGEVRRVRVVREARHLKSILGDGLLLVEDAGWVEWCLGLLSKALGVEFDPVVFPPFLLRKLAERSVVRRAAVFIDEQVTGAPGLSKLVVEGENVVKGAEKLRSRQELNFWYAGPLLELETDRLVVSSSGLVKLKDKIGVCRLREALQLVEELLRDQEAQS